MKAKDVGLGSCHTCGLLSHLPASGHTRCPRCRTPVHMRKSNSLNNTWALLIAAIIAYLPANLYPVMTMVSFGESQSDTIMSGVIYLFTHENWPLGVIVFIASVLVPLLKMLALLYLLITVQRKSCRGKQQRTRLYRIIELVGRWSMVDIFVVALLAALVNAGTIATVEPGVGAIAFSTVVILTMFAAMNFDPRLIWDYQGEKNGGTEPT
ncbi:Paraquat-inducible protein A [hydrothermal vent metagenome]|uniref:Paraquat-inducible protein A n=1 Tax=hydrothermal vent metagenome TaxID=652676 RepID=A0A3B0YPB2_9ZZZZ